MGGAKKKEAPGINLIKNRNKASLQRREGIPESSKNVLESIIDVTDLDEVLEQAESAGRIFSSTHPLPEILGSSGGDAKLAAAKHSEEALHQSTLTIPRRPKWHEGMSTKELDAQERDAFLTWRRGLVRLEENEKLVLTPFEKNLEIWRQLWRVIERSDLVITVVDARDPLFYRCPDLEAYVQEIDARKKCYLLLNKADLLPIPLRKAWSRYFKSKGMNHFFWSAKLASAVQEGKLQDIGELHVSSDGVYISEVGCIDNDIKILTREGLLGTLTNVGESMEANASSRSASDDKNQEDKDSTKEDSKRIAIGFVGYPNVGKSSTINALIGQKRTGVTSTPGKTRHFQTLIVTDRVMLCDCPGLVFPSFTSSKSDMVASGVIPIDRLTDYRGPVQVVATRVSRGSLERTYGISLPLPKPYEKQDRPPFSSELLRSYALSRGYLIHSGLPDEVRAARHILKDYFNGKLLYCHGPPNEDTSERGYVSDEVEENLGIQNNSDKDDDEDHIGEQNNAGTSTEEYVAEDLTIFNVDKLDVENISNANKDRDSRRTMQKVHKMHKKPVRKKDRSWRVKDEDENFGMASVRAVPKPVSHGTAVLGQRVF